MEMRMAMMIVEGSSPSGVPQDEAEYFGGWKPSDGLTSWIVQQFVEGDCGYLALALAEETGWEIRCETNGRYGNHVWVVNDDEKAVDIQGVHKSDYATFPGCPKQRCSRHVETISQYDQASVCWNKPLLELARAIVHFYPGNFGL